MYWLRMKSIICLARRGTILGEKQDNAIIEVAEATNSKIVKLGDMGDCQDMKAIGQFKHNGVANHPNDKGMEIIANLIYDAILINYD